ncbi:MAG TPA: glycoside hydrolase family 15 protein [Thermodesulfobacteriota bacterium]|nr:glycoside hydrolase family 15 protein [Thermodesulfobacteriota bacterium]
MKSDYLPIRDYAFIADCHSSALISKAGSIDWCCMPRFDSGSCFGRILDRNKGGYCQVVPRGAFRVTRRYLPNTLVLETTFRSRGAQARLLDCFTMRRGGAERPHRQILRVLEGVKGKMDFTVEIVPSFEYGAIMPWIRSYRGDGDPYIAMGGGDGLLISGNFVLRMKHRHHLDAACSLQEGDRAYLSILYRTAEDLDEGRVKVPDIPELKARFEETVEWWNTWSSSDRTRGPYAEQAHRSAIVLKGLTNAPTGAIAAAATTSLPESPGGPRNWDYRFTWIRDSCFAVRSLAELGHVKEADGFRRFIERSAAGKPEDIQILFGLGGERRIHEYDLEDLEGYKGARPVRVGNAAAAQRQLDVFGELLDLAFRWHERGESPDTDYWDFLVHLAKAAAHEWKKPDQGMWEMRGEPRHFVHSKVLCWTALERAIRMAEDLKRKAPLEKWKRERQEIRRAVERKGYDRRRGVFIQAFGRPEMDASLLLLPVVGFVDFRDDRMVRTAEAIRNDLSRKGLLLRYPEGNDELEGREGVFLCCSFWMAECLARQGKMPQAREIFERALSTGNDLGLFSEEYDPSSGQMLGNFPQALTHLSLITAAVALDEEADKEAA